MLSHIDFAPHQIEEIPKMNTHMPTNAIHKSHEGLQSQPSNIENLTQTVEKVARVFVSTVHSWALVGFQNLRESTTCGLMISVIFLFIKELKVPIETLVIFYVSRQVYADLFPPPPPISVS